MSQREVVRVKDVMKGNFDLVEGMATVDDALDTMIHVETKTLIVNKRLKEPDQTGGGRAAEVLPDGSADCIETDQAWRVDFKTLKSEAIAKAQPHWDEDERLTNWANDLKKPQRPGGREPRPGRVAGQVQLVHTQARMRGFALRTIRSAYNWSHRS